MKTGGPLLGIRSVEFRATGQMVGKTIPTVRPFDFAGEFVWDPDRFPPGQQDYHALRISDLTRVVYANDYTSPSSSVNPQSFFYILSNTDAANSIVDFADRGRYWRSKVTQPASWHDINSTEALNNAKGSFPDDYYEFTVTAKDAAGNSKDKTQRVLLDNWEQRVGVQIGEHIAADFYHVLVTGSQFTANSSVKVYQMTRNLETGAMIQDGQKISTQGVLLGSAPTDADGNIIPTTFAYSVRNTHYLLADYHGGDDIYQPRLDAITEVIHDDSGSRPQGFTKAAASSGYPAADGQSDDVSATPPAATPRTPSPPAQPVELTVGESLSSVAPVLPPGRGEVGDEPVITTTPLPDLTVFVGATDPLVRRPAEPGEPAPVRPTRVRVGQPPRPDPEAMARPLAEGPTGEPLRLAAPIAAGEDVSLDTIVGDEWTIPFDDGAPPGR